MLHPYASQPFEIQANLEICTVYKGVPYGPAIISYQKNESKYESFKGAGIFNEG